MKKIFIFLTIGLFLQAATVCAQGYNIKISVPKMANSQVILANYFEEKVYTVDTAKLNASGQGIFQKKDKKLARGMYMILFSPSNYFDLVIGNNQNFSITTDTLNILETIRMEGSVENQAFIDFQKFMTAQNRKIKKIGETLEKEPQKESPEIRKKYIEQFNQADNEVRAYIANLGKQYPGSALATFSNFTLSPNIPDFSKEIPESTPDRDMEIRKRGYFYNKDHYWDYTNFKDSMLIRTPIFKNKLDDYFNNIILMHPDSVFKESVNIIEKSKTNKAMFRYLVSYCFNFALESNIMGMDAAFVYIAKKYYLTGQADWVDKENRDKIEREVLLTQYNLLGMKAQELKLPTMDGTWVSLDETEAPFTLLLFWEADCGHCKKQVPLVKTQLLDKFKPYGFKVFAVHTQNDKDKWEKFVTEHELFDFVNCWDPHNQTNFRVYYHIESTPIMYLLDKDKKIIAKKLDLDQLEDLLTKEYKRMGIEIK
ncbi:MAG: DUF5106 domain-containing protein [Odoribacter sp.]